MGYLGHREHDAQRYRPSKVKRHVKNWIRPEKRRQIYQRDGYRCKWCGRRMGELVKANSGFLTWVATEPHQLTLDHKRPLARGGTNSPQNLITSCRRCNCSKGKRSRPTVAPENRPYSVGVLHPGCMPLQSATVTPKYPTELQPGDLMIHTMGFRDGSRLSVAYEVASAGRPNIVKVKSIDIRPGKPHAKGTGKRPRPCPSRPATGSPLPPRSAGRTYIRGLGG